MPVQWNVYESFQALLQAGPYHLALEGFLLLWIVWLVAFKKAHSDGPKLSKKEEEDLLAEWTPEPLVPNPPPDNHPDLSPRMLQSRIGKYITLVDGKQVLNLGSHSYLNMNDRQELEQAALSCIDIYGIGSCGPRGFYGTTKVHLDFESCLASFFNSEQAILYSYAFSTIASAIPAYAKSGDIIYVDECANFAIQRGLQASRSKIFYFRHNDFRHLEELLEEQILIDKKDPKKAAATRRFLIVEGIYINTGEICCLPEMIDICKKYKLRVFIDESHSFGVLGPNARGITDHFNIPIEDIDLLMAGLEASAASTGGFCVGTKYIIEHQVLSGLGYCFSASLPPVLAAVGMKVYLQGNEISPIKHLRLRYSSGDVEKDENSLRLIIDVAEEKGIALVLPSYLRSKESHFRPPSIKILVNKDLTSEEISNAAAAVKLAVETVLGTEEEYDKQLASCSNAFKQNESDAVYEEGSSSVAEGDSDTAV